MPSSSGNRRERRRRDEQPKHRSSRHRNRSSHSTLSEEVTVSPSKSMCAPSLPDRMTESYYSDVTSGRSELSLCVDEPTAICPSMRENKDDSKKVYKLGDGSVLEILDKANSAGKSVSLKLKTGEQIFVERSDKSHSLMILDRKHRVVHAVGTDWKGPEGVYKA